MKGAHNMAIYLVEHKLEGFTGWKLKRRFIDEHDARDFYNTMIGQFSWNTYAKMNQKYGNIIQYRVVKLL